MTPRAPKPPVEPDEDDDDRELTDEEIAAMEAEERRAQELTAHVGQLRIGEHGREPRTQGEKIRWIREQVGPRFGTAMSRADFAILIGKLSGQKPRRDTTYFRWENNRGRGPTVREGIAMVRLVGKTCEWLGSLDDHMATRRTEQDAQRLDAQRALAAAKAEQPKAKPKPPPIVVEAPQRTPKRIPMEQVERRRKRGGGKG